ncbi:MAG: transcriptional activator NhaR [Deltaproteobacteria bacterium]|nr:transcriptional activator NhaR [Deltaproteobacteria bacterium]
MEWLNYHHLLYFWTVARLGSITRATEELYLAQPTISAQLRALEESLGEKLFTRVGRNIALTEMGRVVFRYADEIFTLGRELTDTLKGRSVGRPVQFTVGVVDVMPKLITYRLLQPALELKDPIRIVCHEDKAERLLAELAVHGLDLVLADAPIGPLVKVRAFNHLLGESDVSIFGPPKLAAKYRRKFPESLQGAPMLLPTENTSLRRSFDQWATGAGISPLVVGEFEDSALLKVFGQSGLGLFPAPSVIAEEIQRQYAAQVVGRIEAIRERFYAISIERKLKHPAVVAISEAAQQKLFVQ